SPPPSPPDLSPLSLHDALPIFAIAKPGDTLLGLALSHGGHLTHGSPFNFSGMLFRATSYGVREDTGRIDYDQVREVARRERPRRSEEHTSELQSRFDLVCRLLL